MSPARGYEAEPCHAITAVVGPGYQEAVAQLAPGQILAVDGPVSVDWNAYTETLTVPASAGAYRVQALGSAPVRYVKALVR